MPAAPRKPRARKSAPKNDSGEKQEPSSAGTQVLTGHEDSAGAWRRNPVLWFAKHGRIMRKRVGADNRRLPPEPNWLQKRIGEIMAWCTDRRQPIALIISKPRQKGCSTITVAISYALGRITPLNILFIGGQQSQTENLWRQLRYFHKHDTTPWAQGMHVLAARAEGENGTVITRETAGDPEAGRSGTYHIVVATEVARWPNDGMKNAADVLNSVLNCVPQNEPGTLRIFESTANGPTGVFPETWEGAVEFEEWRQGVRGNGYIRVFAPWHVFDDSRVELTEAERQGMPAKLEKAGDLKALRLRDELGLDWEQIEYYHRLLRAPECGGDATKRDKEYPTTPADGFAASSISRFDAASLNALEDLAREGRDCLKHGTLEMETRGCSPWISFRPCEPSQASLIVAEEPIPGCRYLCSTDNMTGRTHVKGSDPDHNACVVLRTGCLDPGGKWQPAKVVAAIPPGNTWDMDLFATLVERIHLYYGRCLVVPERNRGEYLIAELRKRGVPLHEPERAASVVNRTGGTGSYGWQTTRETKRTLSEEIASHIRDHDAEGGGFSLPFPHIIDQLRTYIVHPDGSEGAMKLARCKDDFVIALGIALCCRRSATLFPLGLPVRPVPWDIAALQGADHEEGQSRIW